jgi:hypothetical protein
MPMIDVCATAGTFPGAPPAGHRPRGRSQTISMVPTFAQEALSHADD